MAFNPDEYLKVNSQKSGFDPDAYLSQNNAPDTLIKDPSGTAQTALESYGNSALMGYLPHVQAGFEKAGNAINEGLASVGMLPSDAPESVDAKLRDQGFKIQSHDPSYVDLRDQNIKRQQAQAEAHPVAAGVGSVAGMVGSGLVAGAAAPMKMAASVTGRALQGAAMGAGMGALQNPGDVEGVVDPLQAGERWDNAKLGAFVGGGSSLAVDALKGTVGGVSRYLKGKAEDKAVKALGPDLRAVRQNMEKDQIREMGRELLDNEVVQAKPVSYDKLSERAAGVRDAKGKEIEGIISDLTNASKELGAKNGVSRSEIAKALRAELIDAANTDIPAVAKNNAAFENLISQFENGGDDLIPLLDAEMKKRAVGRQVNWDRLPGADIPIEEQVNRSLYGKMRQGVEDGAQVLEKEVAGPSSSKFVDAKKSYGLMDEASRIADKKSAREFANRFLSPSDYLTGGLGGVAGFAMGDDIETKLKNAAMGASLGFANKMARNYGNQVAAVGLDRSAQALAKLPVFAKLAQNNPMAFQKFANSVANRGPKFEEQSKDQREFYEQFRQNPRLLEHITNPTLRASIEKKLGIKAQDREPSQAPVTPEDATQQFLQGN